MKDVLKNLVLLLILVLTSCNVEKGLEPENEVKLSLTEVPFENVKNDSKFKKIFANIPKSKGNLIESKTDIELRYNFEITTAPVKIIENDSITSFTLLISRENRDTTCFENLVLQVNNNSNEQSAVLMKYIPTEITHLANNSFTFKGYTQKTDIALLNSNLANKAQGFCNINVLMCNESQNGGLGTAHPAGSACRSSAYMFVSNVKVLCSDDLGGGGGGGANVGGTLGYPLDWGSLGNTYPGGGGGGSATIPGAETPDSGTIITSPIEPNLNNNNVNFSLFLNDIKTANLSTYNYLMSQHAIRNQILMYLLYHGFNADSIIFAKWAVNYLKSNPATTLEQFINQFMGVSEGIDGDYDATYWDDPNLSFPAQDLPNYSDFVAAFPRNLDGSLMAGADNVYSYVGGDVWQARLDYPNKTENTCALKVSRALNYSGISIPNLPGQTIKGGDDKFYFLNSKKLNKWLRKTFGVPTGTNHINSTQAGVHGVNLPGLVIGKKGIYSLVSSNTTWAYGHVDFLKDDATCGVNCHFNDAPIDYIDIWILN